MIVRCVPVLVAEAVGHAGGGATLLLERRAERRIGQDARGTRASPSASMAGTPGEERLQRIGMAQRELHAEREAADLRPQLAAARAGRLDLAELAEHAGADRRDRRTSRRSSPAGRCAAAIFSSQGIVEVMPLVSMNTPRPASPSAPVSASISRSSARREGMGMPFSPLCCSSVEVAKPIAPDAHAPPARCVASRAISASVAGALGGLVAEHVGAHGGMADERGDVRHHARAARAASRYSG